MKLSKWTALVLCVALVFTGCSIALADSTTYHATLMYIVGNDSAPGLTAVQERFNELTLAELNMTVELVPITWGGYTQQIQLVLSGDEPLDICPMMPMYANTFIDAGYVLNLADYLSEQPQIAEVVGESEIMCCSVNGYVYGIPVMMERTHRSAFVMRSDILEEIGVSVDDLHTMEDMTDVFAKVHEKYPDMICFGGRNNSSPVGGGTTDNTADILDDNFGTLLDPTSPIVSNLYESEEYMNRAKLMREWYLAGYVSRDFATSTDSGETLMKAGNLFCFMTAAKPDTKQEKDSQTGYETTVFCFGDALLTTQSTAVLAYTIPHNSENPSKAMELYRWIITTPEACDLLNWGVEGVDWVEVSPGVADFPDGINSDNVAYHQNYGWALPNQQIGHVWNGNDPEIWKAYEEEKENATVSIAYGFSFDGSKVTNEIAALTAVREQYIYTIGSGSVDPETTIAEFNQALYNAGLQTVITEKQNQLNAWLENNK